MDEGTSSPPEGNQRRREFLMIFLFQLASIFLCLLSFVINTTITEAQEFLPISMHASRGGDYRADGFFYSFQRVNSSLITEILRDRDPLARDIAYRATEVSYIFQTPIPSVTPNISAHADIAISNPTSSSTALKNPISTRTPLSVPFLEPTLTSTSSPTHILITKPTYPPPTPHPYTSMPHATPTKTPSKKPASFPTATTTPSSIPSNTVTPISTPTGEIRSQTPTATSTPTLTLTITTTPTITSTIRPTYTQTPTDTPTPTSSRTPTITPSVTSTPTKTSTSTPTDTPTSTFTPTPSPTYTQTGTFTLTDTPSPSPTPTPILPVCFNGIPPGVLPADDAYLKANSPTTNFGSLSNIEVRPDRAGNWRGLIRFDLSSIPQGSLVTQATLHLFEKDEKIGQVTDIYRVTTSWNEASVTWNSPWNNPGGDINSSTIYVSFIPSQKNCMITLDLTGLVQEWVNGTPNYGMMLLSTGPNHIIRYSSKEETLVVQQPKLEVIYSIP